MSEPSNKKIIWTMGHSTRTFDDFIEMLKSFQIEVLVDIRSLPGSKRYPHFNKENLQKSLSENNIEYIHFKDLGGRRKVRPDSKNTAWRNASFRAYADYMETEDFKKSVEELEQVAVKERTAYMCSEAVWFRCHRSLVSDYLKFKGWEVKHIMGIGKSKEHPYTSPAKITDEGVSYEKMILDTRCLMFVARFFNRRVRKEDAEKTENGFRFRQV